MIAGLAGAGLVGAVGLRRFNSTTAPFERFYELTGGELQPSATLLIFGNPGGGTTTLGLELLQHSLAKGGYSGLLTYDAFPSEIQARMKTMGWDITNNLNNGTLKIIDCYSALAGNENAEIRDALDFTEISIQVTRIIDAAAGKPVTVLLDSMVPIFTGSQPAAAMNFLRVLSAKIKNNRGVFIITGTKGSIPDEAQSKVEAFVDGVIELSLARKGRHTTRTLLIKRLPGRQASTAPAEIEIAPNSRIVFKKHRLTLHSPFHHANP
jgi:KaiC/GvpD/RAD55 family RecA-like ATPase